MRSRLQLQTLLETISPNVYYSPPETLKIKYPAIIYKRETIDSKHADDLKYLSNNRYKVTYITKDVDSPTINAFMNLPLCGFDNEYVSDNLEHYVFTLYF